MQILKRVVSISLSVQETYAKVLVVNGFLLDKRGIAAFFGSNYGRYLELRRENELTMSVNAVDTDFAVS